MSDDRGRDAAVEKLKPGDGSRLKPIHSWDVLSRSLFYLKLRGADGSAYVYAVDVLYWDDKAELYLNGKQEATWEELPATFPVHGGVIEVATTIFGLKRLHYVPESGRQRQLTPDPASGEGLRARLDTRHPRVSRFIGGLSWLILVIALLLGLPQLLEVATSIGAVSDIFGTFASPVLLPASVNTGLTIAAVVASIERALRLRHHWLLDGDDIDWDDD